MKIKIFILMICSFLLTAPVRNETIAAEPLNDPFHSYLLKGIDKAFNLETNAAGEYLMKAVELEPENPAGYAYLAMLNLFTYEMSLDQNERTSSQEALLRHTKDAIDRAEKKIKNNPHDSQAYFAVSLAKITKIQWAVHEKRYFIIAQETSNIWDDLEKAKEQNPQNSDLCLLTGGIHYHLSHLPGFIRFLSSAFIVDGNGREGLQELELAAQKGDLLKDLAQAELVSAYLNFEKQPAKALPPALELNKKFPDNYNFLFALGNIYADMHRFDEAFNIAREIEKNIRTGNNHFVPQLQPRYQQLMGRIFFNRGSYDLSAEYFHNVLEDKAFYNARSRAWALVRLGMIHDIRKERKQAEECYVKALEEEGGEGLAKIEARKYLKQPYTISAN